MVRYIATIGLLLVGALPGFLMAADERLSIELADCRRVADSLRRLICYDDIEVGGSPVAPSGPIGSAPAPVAPSAAEPVATAPIVERSVSSPLTPVASAEPIVKREAAPVQVRSQALKPPPPPEPQVEQAAQEIRSTVVQIQKQARGQLVMRLENGQVWSQQSSEKMRLRVGDEIQISRGLFGGFRLSSGSDKGIRVKRQR